MSNNYINIQQLISLWQTFEEQTGGSDFGEFGHWLYANKSIENKNNDTVLNENLKDKTIDYKHLFLFLITRISRIHDFYCKKYFEGLPINTLLEFNFLFSINKNRSYKKSDIIHLHLVEYTTGIDVLKRFVKLGLISEYKDQLDKRSKRIKITADGKKVLMEALLRINKVQELFFGETSIDEPYRALPLLEKLNQMHNKVTKKYEDTSYLDIIHSLNLSS